MARQTRAFWERTLQAGKVQEALESLGGDLDAFEKAYHATRRSMGPRSLTARFTPDQLESIRTFRSNGGIEGLASELGVTVSTARGVVARAVEEGLL